MVNNDIVSTLSVHVHALDSSVQDNGSMVTLTYLPNDPPPAPPAITTDDITSRQGFGRHGNSQSRHSDNSSIASVMIN